MKAVTLSFVFAFATVSILLAQTEAPAPAATEPVVTAQAPAPASATPASDAPVTPEEQSIAEAVHRQANQIEAQKRLEQADAADRRNDLEAAAKRYDEAFELAQNVGPTAEQETRVAVAGIISVRLRLANIAEKHGDYGNVDLQLKDVLR